jgi:hypothetical protein
MKLNIFSCILIILTFILTGNKPLAQSINPERINKNNSTTDFSIQAPNMKIDFTYQGYLKNISVNSSCGWDITPDVGSIVSGRRAGEWCVKCGDKFSWLKPKTVTKKDNVFIQNCVGQNADLTVKWEPVFEDAFLVTCELKAKKNFPSVSIGLDAFNLKPEMVKHTYCLPFSLSYIRKDADNKIPSGFIDDELTFNNTFSLITDKETFSLSVIPEAAPNSGIQSENNPHDYQVGFYPSTKADPNELLQPITGGIILIANHAKPVHNGGVIIRQFLIAASANLPGFYATGKHIGQYMATVKYSKQINLLDLYRKSMSFLLNNPYCFTETKYGNGFWGSIHSKTGEGFCNGRAFYAMYGSSFSVAAFSQYEAMNGLNPQELYRFQTGPARLLTNSDASNADGAFWSMLDVDKGEYVDQAGKKWMQTHATGWVAYYLLCAYEINHNIIYLNKAQKALKWLTTVQNKDGSFPKYFENNNPSIDKQGDLAWNILAFLKADTLGISSPTIDFRKCALKSSEWMLDNPVKSLHYFGAFEDVGGVTESYTSSVSALALVVAYKTTGNLKYLQSAKSALSVSLAWVTCGYTPVGQLENSWDKDQVIQPAYAQVESIECYYPCSYTLPMLFLASAQIAGVTQGSERNYWLQISRQFSHLVAFFSNTPGSAAKYGMEWLNSPFLVFPEWGNAQVCWSILETLRQRAALEVPGFNLDAQMHCEFKGKKMSVITPKWEEVKGNLLKLNPEIDPLVLKGDDGSIYLLLLSEGQNIQERLNFNALADYLPIGTIKLTNFETGLELGVIAPQHLSKEVYVKGVGHLIIQINSIK